MSPCIAAKLATWEQKRAKEIEQAANEAAAEGEELRISAEQEELLKQEALEAATAECR